MEASLNLPLVNDFQTKYPTKSNNLLKLVLICILLVSIVYGAHALEKHGEAAALVRKTMEEKGAIEAWVKADGRIVNICKVDETLFGIMITTGNREVTCFVKEKLTRLEQVRQYLKNMGAKQLWTKH